MIRSLVRILVPIGVVLLLSLGVVYWIGRRFPTDILTVATSMQTRPIAVEKEVIRQVTKWETRTVEIPVIVREPTPKQAEKAEKDTGIPIPTFVEAGDRELGIFPVDPAPHGGNAYVGIKADGNTRFVFAPRRPPVFELGGPWRLSAGVGVDQGQELQAEVELRKDLLTVRGQWHVGVVGRIGGRRGGETDVRGLVQVGKSF